MSAAFIATLEDGSGYALVLDGKLISTHGTAAEADRARQALLRKEPALDI